MKPKALLLTPGAGADRENATLRAIDAAVAPLAVERMDFPYRKAGRKAPDRAPILIEAVREEAATLVRRAHTRPAALVLGGRSMGGRICSMAVAEGLPAAGLVLLSYPLHPPGRSDKLRIEHLPALSVPCLFISGTKDQFRHPRRGSSTTPRQRYPGRSPTCGSRAKATPRVAATTRSQRPSATGSRPSSESSEARRGPSGPPSAARQEREIWA